jgi:hypothetical protein
MMRTTLDIDDDVLHAAKERARRERKTTGEVLSELARAALTAPDPAQAEAQKSPTHYGIRPFPRRGGIVTNDLVNRLRQGEPD